MSTRVGDDQETPHGPLFGDAEAAAASGVPVPSLRVLQAAGAITSHKEPKPHGGFKRMWPEKDVLKASIASAMSEHFAWNIRLVSEVLAKTPFSLWDVLVEIQMADDKEPENMLKTVVKSCDTDWHIDLIDRRFLFLCVSNPMSIIFPDNLYGQTNLIIGIINNNVFSVIPWAFGSPQGRGKMKEALSPDLYEVGNRVYTIASAANQNFLSKTTINASLQVRRACKRLHGHEAYFFQDLLEIRNGDAEE